jgi:hypothetical protein
MKQEFSALCCPAGDTAGWAWPPAFAERALLPGQAGGHRGVPPAPGRPYPIDLPAAWDGLHLRFRCLGCKVRLNITHLRMEISAYPPLMVALPSKDATDSDGRRQPPAG